MINITLVYPEFIEGKGAISWTGAKLKY